MGVIISIRLNERGYPNFCLEYETNEQPLMVRTAWRIAPRHAINFGWAYGKPFFQHRRLLTDKEYMERALWFERRFAQVYKTEDFVEVVNPDDVPTLRGIGHGR